MSKKYRYKYTFEYKDGSGGKYVYSSSKNVYTVAEQNHIPLTDMEIIHIRDEVKGITIFDPWKGIFNAE